MDQRLDTIICIVTKWRFRFNEIPIKIPAGFPCENWQVGSNIDIEFKRHGIPKIILKKEKIITKIYYKATLINTEGIAVYKE